MVVSFRQLSFNSSSIKFLSYFLSNSTKKRIIIFYTNPFINQKSIYPIKIFFYLNEIIFPYVSFYNKAGFVVSNVFAHTEEIIHLNLGNVSMALPVGITCIVRKNRFLMICQNFFFKYISSKLYF